MFELRDYAEGSVLFESEKIAPVIPPLEKMGKKSEDVWACTPELKLYSCDLSELDLSAYNMQDINFDDRTRWPSNPTKNPKGYVQLKKIIENGKNQGLGIRTLHKMGYDGSGVNVAIIDQPLSDHSEYHDNLEHYEEIGYEKSFSKGSMHGAAVASILIGKTCGIVPKAKLYYFAANSIKIKNGQKIKTAGYRAQALERILKINEDFEKQGCLDKKIQVVSVSAGWMGSPKTEDSDKWWKVLEKAKKTGLFVLTTNSRKEYGLGFTGLGKNAYADSDQLDSYLECPYNLPESYLSNKGILVPMDHRTLASPTGKDEYVHYVHGGMSWATPWMAGMFALARQITPYLTPENFWKIAMKSSIFNEKVHGKVIQPKKLIKSLQKEKIPKNIKKIMQNGQKRAIQRCKVRHVIKKLKKGEENAK